MHDNTNFNIMYGFVQGTGLTYGILLPVIQIWDSRCVYFIFSLMTAYETSRNICILYIFIMHFFMKCFALTEAPAWFNFYWLIEPKLCSTFPLMKVLYLQQHYRIMIVMPDNAAAVNAIALCIAKYVASIAARPGT